MDYAFDVKITLKALTSQDLEKVLKFYHDEDYWNYEDSINIETVVLEGEGEKKGSTK